MRVTKNWTMNPLKLILVGDSGSGKTTLIKAFLESTKIQKENPTISPTSYSVDIETDTGKILNLQIWDTAGQEKYYSLSQIFYREANLALICYESLSTNRIQLWIDRVREVAPACMIILVQTKCDLLSEEEQYNARDQGFTLRQEFNAISHFITSAFNGLNVYDVFADSAKLLDMIQDKSAVLLNVTQPNKENDVQKCGC